MIIYEGSKNDIDDIVLCAETICATPYGSMPYMRDFGIQPEVLALNTPMQQDEFYDQAIDQIEAWEDRATVKQMDVMQQDGKMQPKVVIEDGE